MVPFIENVSMENVKTGYHYDPGPNSMLIQIVDPAYEFPVPKYSFKEIHQFEFLDDDMPSEHVPEEFLISDGQAKEIVFLLKRALDNCMNVIVHCHAGVCRSGAIAEVGEIVGFAATGNHRIPNTLVKKKLLNVVMENDFA